MIKDKWVYILIILVSCFLGMMILKNTIEKVITIEKDIQKSKKNINTLEVKAQQLAAIDENELKRKVQLIEETYPSYRPILDIINSLQQLSVSQNVVFKGVDLAPGKLDDQNDSTRQEFVINFSIVGDLSQINSFISELKRTPPPMKIESLDLRILENESPDKTEPVTKEANLITTNLTVTVYYQPMPADIGTIDRPLVQLSDDERNTLKKISSFNIFPKMQTLAVSGKEDLFSLP